MSSRRICTRVSEELYVEFVTAAIKKYRGRKGSIQLALEEAIRLWLERNAHV